MPVQIRLETPEIEFFEEVRKLRRLEKEVRPCDEERKKRLKRSVQFFARDVHRELGERTLGPWWIDASNAVQELASVGQNVMRTIQSDEWNTLKDTSDHERDSVLGSQSDVEDDYTLDEEDPPLSWDRIKEMAPSYVKQLVFVVADEEMSATDHQRIRNGFPGVHIRNQSLPLVHQAIQTSETALVHQATQTGRTSLVHQATQTGRTSLVHQATQASGASLVHQTTQTGANSLVNQASQTSPCVRVAEAGTMTETTEQLQKTTSTLVQTSLPPTIPPLVNSVIFEVDELEAENDPQMIKALQEAYPWASIRKRRTSKPDKPSPLPLRSEEHKLPDSPPVSPDLRAQPTTRIAAKSNYSAPRAPSNAEPEIHTIDPIRYTNSFAKFVMQAPADEEFGYKYKISHDWENLPNPRKVAIAHARCIQKQYGESVAQEDRCTRCSQRGYTCRVYQSTFIPLSNMDLGHGCQNCRVWGETCDCPATPPTYLSADSSTQTPKYSLQLSALSIEQTSPIPTRPKADRRMSDVTPTKTPTRKLSVTSCMTNHDPSDIRIKGAADQANNAENGNSDSEGDRHPTRNSGGTPIGRFPTSSLVHKVLREIGLKTARPDVIQLMYNFWVSTNAIRTRQNDKVEHYYVNLVDLYIVGNATNDAALQSAALKRFQETNFEYVSVTTWPPLYVAMRAFQYLPASSPLRQWMTVLWSFLWHTETDGTYKQFRRQVRHYSDQAVMEFLHGIAQTRCPYTEGLNTAVLEHWCTFHDHPKGGKEEQLCKANRDSVSKVSLVEERAQKHNQDVRDAVQLIKEMGWTVIEKDNARTATPAKRKAGALAMPVRPTAKKFKQGSSERR